MKKLNPVLGKILYSLLFVAIIPLLLWFWAGHTGRAVKYPPIESVTWGAVLLLAGGALMIWGMMAIVLFGKGLPMNAYPPEKFVTRGPYHLIRHPIYWGFGIMVCGMSVLTGSASGLWLVTPITILAMTSLVLGFEQIGLQQRFPGEKIRTFFDQGGNEQSRVTLKKRLAAILLFFIVLLLSNFMVGYLAGGADPLIGKSWKISTFFEQEPLRFLSLFFIIGVPMTLKRQDLIRDWLISVVAGLALSVYISLLWPAAGAQYFVSGYTMGNLPGNLNFLFGSIPLFLVLLSLKFYVKQFRYLVILLIVFATFLGLVQLVNCRSSVQHLIVSIFIYYVAANYLSIWILLKNFAERMANSWKEWVIGPVRIINHAFIIGFGAIFGVLYAGILAGREYAWAILIFAVVLMICSAIWAQLIEGSDKLKRPFGYYGAIVGIIFASLILWQLGYNVWLLIGLASVLMPWVQAIGRFRCLANGCCHGRPTSDDRLGIRYFHDRTRVCGLSGLKGKLIHPTPLYSIVWLFFVGFVMLALWHHHLPYSFMFGLYLILTSTGRFVEEAYRGEVQTPIFDGLHLYQWIAIISALLGIIITIIPVKVVELHPVFGWEIPVAAFILGLLSFFAMGVDFPKSNVRFSRLV